MNRVKIALYEPEIPQNLGSVIRSCACFNAELHLIEPFGFLLEDKSFKRAKMDYNTTIIFYKDFSDFIQKTEDLRKILLTPHCSFSIKNIKLTTKDILFFGRESDGVETKIAEHMIPVSIPMHPKCRSLNLSVSVSIVLSMFA